MADLGNFDITGFRNAKDAAEAYKKALEKSNKEQEKLRTGLDKLSQSAIGIQLSKAFEEVPRSIKDTNEALKDLQRLMADILDDNDEIFHPSGTNDLAKQLGETLANTRNLNKDLLKVAPAFQNIQDRALRMKIADAFKFGDLTSVVKEYGDDAVEAIIKVKKALGGTAEQQEEIIEQIRKINENTKLYHVEEERFQKEQYKRVFSLSKLMDTITDNIGEKLSLNKALANVTDYDQRLAEINRKFNLTGDEIRGADKVMGDLVRSGALLGASMEDVFSMTTDIANIMRTTNVAAAGEFTKAVYMIPRAFGIAREDVSQLAGTLAFYGVSVDKTAKIFQTLATQSKIYGVNVSKVAASVAAALPKWKAMGFKAGEESLAKMAAKAEKLGMKIESILDVADKMQDLEGSMESAASLNVLGGSFANADPFQLMSAAVQGGDAMLDMIKNLSSDIGRINKNGEFELTFVDRKRLKAASEALGYSYDEMFNMVKQGKEKVEKEAKMSSQLNFFAGLSPDDKQMLENYVKFDGKELKVTGLKGIDNIKQLQNLSQKEIQDRMKAAVEEQKNATKMAEQRTSLNESFKMFTDQFLNIFTHLEPLIKSLTSAMMWVNEKISKAGTWITNTFGANAPWIKVLVGFGAILLTTFGTGSIFKIIFGSNGLFAKGFGKLTGGLLGKNNTSSISGQTPTSPTQPTSGNGWLKSLSEGLKSFGQNSGQILKGAATLAASLVMISLPLLGITAVLGKVGGEFGVGKLAAFGLSIGMMAIIMKNLDKLSAGINLASVAKFSLALGIIGGVVVGLTYLMGLSSGVKGNQILALSSTLLLLGGSVLAISKLGTQIDQGGILKTSLALGAIGIGLATLTVIMSKIGGEASVKGIASMIGVLIPTTLAMIAVSKISKGIDSVGLLKASASFGIIGIGLGAAMAIITKYGSALSSGQMLSVFVTLGVVTAAMAGASKIASGINVSSMGKVALSMGIIGAGLAGFMVLVNKAGGLTSIENLAKSSLSLIVLTGSLAAVSNIAQGINIKGLLGASLAMTLIGAALYPFALSAQMFTKVKWEDLAKIGTSIVGLSLALAGLSFLAMPILIGSAALAAASISLGIFGAGMWVVAKSFNELNKVEWKSVGDMAMSLLKLTPSIAAISIVGVPAMVGLMALGTGLNIFSKLIANVPSLLIPLVPAMESLSAVNFGFLSEAGSALVSLIPSLLGIAAVGVVSENTSKGLQMVSLLGNSLKSFATISVKNIADAAESLGGLSWGLIKFSASGFVSGKISDSANSLLVLGEALSKLSGISFGSIGNIPATLSQLSNLPISAIVGSAAFKEIGKNVNAAISDFKQITTVDWGSLEGMSKGLDMLTPSINNFAANGVTNYIQLKAISSGFESFSSKIVGVINPITMASKTINLMAESLINLKAAISSVDTTNLAKVNEMSNNLFKGSNSSKVAAAYLELPNNNRKSNEPIEIKLKEPIIIDVKLNGRALERIRLDDTKFLT